MTRTQLNDRLSSLLRESERLVRGAWDAVNAWDYCGARGGPLAETCAAATRWGSQLDLYASQLRVEVLAVVALPDERLSEADAARIEGMARVIATGARELRAETEAQFWDQVWKGTTRDLREYVAAVGRRSGEVVGGVLSGAVGGVVGGLGPWGLLVLGAAILAWANPSVFRSN